MISKQAKGSLRKGETTFIAIAAIVVLIIIAAGILIKRNSDNQLGYVQGMTLMGKNTACPGCGQWGDVLCPYCRGLMSWNYSQGIYTCPWCQRKGVPFCPSCMRPIITQSQGMISCIPPSYRALPKQVISPQYGPKRAA